MSAPQAALSETELEVLKVLWEHGPGTVREVNEILSRQGRQWAYTTVLTLLSRLEQKGYVASDKTGLAHVFRGAVSRDALLSQRLTHLADELCEGTATPLVTALVEGRKFSAAEIEHFRRLLDELETQQTAEQIAKPARKKRGR
jgi:predicted transcriptional regulator